MWTKQDEAEFSFLAGCEATETITEAGLRRLEVLQRKRRKANPLTPAEKAAITTSRRKTSRLLARLRHLLS